MVNTRGRKLVAVLLQIRCERSEARDLDGAREIEDRLQTGQREGSPGSDEQQTSMSLRWTLQLSNDKLKFEEL